MPNHKPFTLPPGEGAKVCVGGGAGFIGSHIAKRLKENGYHVTVVGECLVLFSFVLLLTVVKFWPCAAPRCSDGSATRNVHEPLRYLPKARDTTPAVRYNEVWRPWWP